jgi:hypothetical protein
MALPLLGVWLRWKILLFSDFRCRFSRKTRYENTKIHATPIWGHALNGAPLPPSFCGGKPPNRDVRTARTSPINSRPGTLSPQSLQWKKPKIKPPTGTAKAALMSVIINRRLAFVFAETLHVIDQTDIVFPTILKLSLEFSDAGYHRHQPRQL